MVIVAGTAPGSSVRGVDENYKLVISSSGTERAYTTAWMYGILTAQWLRAEGKYVWTAVNSYSCETGSGWSVRTLNVS